MKKAVTTFIAAASLVVLTAAAKPHSGTAATSVSSSKPAVVIMGDDMKFSPARIVIHRGQMVAWENLSHQIHNVVDIPDQSPKKGVMTLPKGASTFDSGLMNYGATFVQTFNVPGTYKYACSLHIANGMLGEIIVK